VCRKVSFNNNQLSIMKPLFFALFFFALLAASCNKSEPVPPIITNPTPKEPTWKDLGIPFYDYQVNSAGDTSSGWAHAVIFEKDWHASAYMRILEDSVNQSYLVFETWLRPGAVGELFILAIFNGAKPGRYALKNEEEVIATDSLLSAGYTVQDDDLPFANYEIDPTYQSYLNIDSNDGKYVSGHFSMLYRLVPNPFPQPVPMTFPKQVFFENGTFRVKVP
jgi:hypothetical protein